MYYKCKYSLLSLLFLFTISSLNAKSEQESNFQLSGNFRAYIQNTDISGATPSVDREGTIHYEELGINIKDAFGDSEVGTNIRLRATNDERVQKDEVELLYLRSYYKERHYQVEVGDVASSFNPYVYSGSLKGVKFLYKDVKKTNALDYALISGVKKASWQELYSDNATEDYTAYVAAAEIKYRYQRAKEIKMSLSLYEDDINSGGSANFSNAKKGYSVGLEGKWRFNKYITLKGYGAYVRGNDDTKNSNSDCDGSAVTIKLLTRPLLRTIKSNFIYQRISAKYIPFGSVALSDIERIENSTLFRVNRALQLKLELKLRHNNVDNDSIDKTEYIYFERVALNYRPHFLKRASLDMRLSNKEIEGGSRDSNEGLLGIDFTHRSRDGWRYGMGYEYVHFEDKISSIIFSQYINNYKFLFGYKQKLSKESRYRVTTQINYKTFSHEQERVGLKIDAGYSYAKKITTDLLYLLNNTQRDSLDNTSSNRYQFMATYKLDTKGRDFIRLLLEKRDVKAENSSSDSYDEYIEKLSFAMNF